MPEVIPAPCKLINWRKQTNEKKSISFIMAAAVCVLSACGNAQNAIATGENALTRGDIPTPSVTAVQGDGSLAYREDEDTLLTPEQEELLLGYMDLYYNSLATFTLTSPADLFSADAATQAAGNEAVWQYLIGLRQMQQTDLRLTAYSYRLTVISVEQEDDTLLVMAVENSIQNFAAHPEIDSESYGTYHIFHMAETASGWKLTEHAQWDYLYSTIMGLDREFYELPGAFPEIDYSEQITALLSAAKEYLAARQVGALDETITAENAYDRTAAVAYANTWANDRNEEWPDYSMSGGNCQNFASQCVYEGGVPMDSTGAYVWKWYGTTPDNTATRVGRSASWSGVKAFLDYARWNSGYGLVAEADAPYYSGEPGDLIIMGSSDDWRHTVVVVDTVTDENGATVDYLVNSNTGGLKNFPVSAHPYCCQTLVHIIGWNS